MRNIKIEISRREKKNGREREMEYAIIFKEFCPHYMKNRIKENPKYDSIIVYTLKLIDTISQSIHGPIRTAYSYL